MAIVSVIVMLNIFSKQINAFADVPLLARFAKIGMKKATTEVIALVFGVSIQRVGVYGIIFVIVLFGERSASP